MLLVWLFESVDDVYVYLDDVDVPDVDDVAAYHPAYHCWLASEAKQGWSWSVPGWETDAAGSGVGGPVGGTLSSGLKNIPMPQGSDWGHCPLSDGTLNGCPDSLRSLKIPWHLS